MFESAQDTFFFHIEDEYVHFTSIQPLDVVKYDENSKLLILWKFEKKYTAIIRTF